MNILCIFCIVLPLPAVCVGGFFYKKRGWIVLRKRENNLVISSYCAEATPTIRMEMFVYLYEMLIPIYILGRDIE